VRIDKAAGVFSKLGKLWKSKKISLSVKTRLYETLVLSTLLNSHPNEKTQPLQNWKDVKISGKWVSAGMRKKRLRRTGAAGGIVSPNASLTRDEPGTRFSCSFNPNPL